MMIIERVVVLGRATVFEGLPDHVLAEVAQIVKEVWFDAGDVLIEQGREESWMFLLVDGQAEVRVNGQAVATLDPGAVIGELAALDPSPRSATVVITEPSLAFRIAHEPFREVMLDQPALMAGLVTTLARRLRATNEQAAAAQLSARRVDGDSPPDVR